MSDELRAFTRVATALDTELVAAGGRSDGLTRDVSLNGIFVTTAALLPAGSSVTVTLFLGDRTPDAPRIQAHGSIAQVRAGGLAVAFREFADPDSYGHLRRIIELNSRDQERIQAEFARHLGLRPQ
jgi:hypothetical protein